MSIFLPFYVRFSPETNYFEFSGRLLKASATTLAFPGWYLIIQS